MRSSPDTLIDVLKQVDDPLALLAGLFFHSPVAFQVYRSDGHSLVVNPAFRALFGNEPPPEYNILRDEIAEAHGLLALIRRAFEGETVRTPTIWYDAKKLKQVRITEANRIAFESVFFPLRDADGTIRHVAIAFEDLTIERTLREQAESERDLLSLIIAQSGNGIVVADPTGTLRMFNAEAERQHGVTFRAVAADDWAETYGLFDLAGRRLDLAETALHRALRGEKVDNSRWMVKRPDGSTRILSGSATPLRNPDGSSAGAVLITRDETSLIEDERRLRFQATIMENVRDSIIVTDTSGNIIEWNRGAQDIFGYGAGEVLGRSAAFLYPNHDAPLSSDLDAIADGKDYVAEWEGRCKDGSHRWLDVKTTRLLDGDGVHVGYIGIGKDVTDRKRAERERSRAHEERQRALAMAEAANRSKDEFLAMLGHELRNPLSPIVTALELMKMRGNGALSREQQVIERQVGHLVRLVDDLLDISRITGGKVELKKASVDLGRTIGKAIEIASPLIERRRHELRLMVPPNGMRLEADGERLAQVFANLLTNAAKYTDPGGTIELEAKRDGDELVVRVKDSGIGIPASLLPQIFDLFVQGHRSSDRAPGGLGIGLALVRNLVQMHGGTVVATSDGPGTGTEVVVRLPGASGDARPTPEPPMRAFVPTEIPRRVLVVDDNVDAAELMAEILREVGHVVTVAHDGPLALAAITTFHAEVALLDIGLPVMDGYELGKQLRAALGDKLTLIAMTGYGQPADRARSAAAGFFDHLVKPVSSDELLARIDRIP